MAKSFIGQSNLPRGLRNNNPGNLRYTPSIKWVGQTGSDGAFSIFSNLAYGIRAYGMDLRNDIKKGKNTIDKLIYEFAPPSENNTEAYINNVSKISGISRKQILTPDIDTLTKIAKGMFSVELGANNAAKITESDIREGLSMMGGAAPLGAATLGIGGFVIIIGLTILLLTLK
jgi:hypothetical protein